MLAATPPWAHPRWAPTQGLQGPDSPQGMMSTSSKTLSRQTGVRPPRSSRAPAPGRGCQEPEPETLLGFWEDGHICSIKVTSVFHLPRRLFYGENSI